MKTIGKYKVCGLLGRGGMATVYKVRMPVLDKIVALKLLAPHPHLVSLLGMEEITRRFVTEAVTMGQLRHPNIVDIRDFDEHNGRPFLVMEYYCSNLGLIMGEDYRLENPSRLLTLDKAIHYTRQILAGLACLHHAEIIHRDIKPFNILITDDDNVKISDFGLSRLRGEAFHSPRGLMVGSPYYAAPEQERDPDRVDARADIYGVGVMLHRMLTGMLPIDGCSRPSACNPSLGRDWEEFLRTATAQNRDERFSSAREMSSRLNELYETWQEKQQRICRTATVEHREHAGALPMKRVLRAQSIKVGPRRARAMLHTDALWRPLHYLAHDFQVNDDGTVWDKATGLIWESTGSSYPLPWSAAHAHVNRLNQQRFAGRGNWRLPTVNELSSLLTRPTAGGESCIEQVFDRTKRWLWSSDRRSFTATWYVSVDMGFVAWQDVTCHFFARAVCAET